MTINKKIDGDTMTISVEGWLDTMTAPQFHDEVQDLSGAKNVILDFGGLEYISSAGLREIVTLYHTVSAQDGAFSIRKINPEVMDVFTLTGFDKKLGLQDD